jgi:hypothetical protein
MFGHSPSGGSGASPSSDFVVIVVLSDTCSVWSKIPDLSKRANN